MRPCRSSLPSKIDVTFDHRTDSNGRDPDSNSLTLKNHHKLLWTKPLPGGKLFSLQDEPGKYLSFEAGNEKFFLSSDSISNSLANHKKLTSLMQSVPKDDVLNFRTLGATIGAYTLFPSNRIDGKPTINAARGMNARIGDRFDLTLECIRRHYTNEPSPLSDTLARYKSFFALFQDFRGYAEFFLLQDLVNETFTKIKFYLPFENDFLSQTLPTDLRQYETYRIATESFVTRRNYRIALLQ